MLLPTALHTPRIEEARALELRPVEQVLRPVAQGTGEPRPDRNVEPLLRSFEQRFGEVAAQDLPQQPFALPVANLHGCRQPPRELDDAMVEEWASAFETRGHGRAVELHQDVAWKIADHVAIDEAADR